VIAAKFCEAWRGLFVFVVGQCIFRPTKIRNYSYFEITTNSTYYYSTYNFQTFGFHTSSWILDFRSNFPIPNLLRFLDFGILNPISNFLEFWILISISFFSSFKFWFQFSTSLFCLSLSAELWYQFPFVWSSRCSMLASIFCSLETLYVWTNIRTIWNFGIWRNARARPCTQL